MRRSMITILIAASLAAVSGMTTAAATSLTPEQEEWLAKANRHEKGGWIYLHIEGGARERGFQYGYLLAKEIHEAVRVLGVSWQYKSGMDWQWYVDRAGEILTPKVDSENTAEIDGMVEGMAAAGEQTTRNELVALNGYMELMWYWWPAEKESLKIHSPEEKKQSCSSFIATGSMTRDGKIVLGHNSMVGYEDPFCNIVLDIKPDRGHRILMQAFTGFIHSGTDFFVTDAGLVGSETTIGAFFPFDKNGAPEFSRMRHATQYAGNIDEWCGMMKKDNNGGYANAWLLGDIKTNEIARLELGLKYAGFEKKKDGYFIGSNVAEDVRILRFETNENETNIKYSSVARRVRWKELMKEYKGRITAELARNFESDHYDSYLRTTQPSGRTLCGHEELDPMTNTSFEPFSPGGTLDGKVLDATMAKEMSFVGRWGAACGRPFDAKQFLSKHPQYDWMAGILKDRPAEPWTVFRAGER